MKPRLPRPLSSPALPAARRRLLGLLALLPLAGCQALGVTSPPFAVLQPRPVLAPLPGAPVPWQLVIETPSASDVLDSTHIAVMPSPGVLQVYPGARWPEPVPLLLRGLVLRGFERSGRILGVAPASAGLQADVALALDVHDFQMEVMGGASRAALRLQARLIDTRSNRVLDARSFAAEAPGPGDTAAAALPAFERALGELIPQLVAWSLCEDRVPPVPQAARRQSAR